MVAETIETAIKKPVVTEKPKVVAPKPVEVASETRSLPLRSERKRTSALSLKSLSQKVEAIEVVDIEEIDRNTLPKTPFTLTELTDFWNTYTKEIHDIGDKSLASILSANTPILNNFEITYTLPNSLMSDQLERLKPQFLKQIREHLNNYSIDLTILVEETAVKKFVYTTLEKYNKLKEINPDVELLKNIFQLDI